jgi:hypothetical protein
VALKIRSITKNNNASGFGTLLIVFPFIVSIVLTAVYIPMGITAGMGTVVIQEPDNYDNMTTMQREYQLALQFGGYPTHEWRWGLKMSFPDWAGRWYYVYPDGTALTDAEYNRYLEGQGSEPDYYGVVMSMLSLNPPALERIGIFGLLIRILLIASICIGLVEIVWIGG